MIYVKICFALQNDQCKTVGIAVQCGLPAGLKRSSCSAVTVVTDLFAPSSVNTADLHIEFLLCSSRLGLLLFKLKVDY